MTFEGERLRLEKKIQRYRRIAKQVDDDTAKLIYELITDLERKLREMVE